jgi:ABC-type multidrug transport system fused ATPase/permease subunit
MNEYMKKWGLIAKALGITAILVAIRLVIDISNYDIIALTNLITAFIGAAIFTVAVIFTGTLTDYKESEKIPNEIAVSLLTVYQDCKLIRPADNPISLHLREHTQALARIIVENFKTNSSNNERVRAAIAQINEDLYTLVDQNAPPQYVNKIRTELGNIDRLTSRVRTIAETSFIPAAYAIAEIAVIGVILILFFVKIDPYYEGMIIFSIIIALLISIILLIKDMDNPFEYGKKTFADVDLSPILEIEKYLD